MQLPPRSLCTSSDRPCGRNSGNRAAAHAEAASPESGPISVAVLVFRSKFSCRCVALTTSCLLRAASILWFLQHQSCGGTRPSPPCPPGVALVPMKRETQAASAPGSRGNTRSPPAVVGTATAVRGRASLPVVPQPKLGERLPWPRSDGRTAERAEGAIHCPVAGLDNCPMVRLSYRASEQGAAHGRHHADRKADRGARPHSGR